jgi:predicted TIM-barrel fold metal-dependent hydrolase
MAYARRVCCDADSHFMETFDWIASYADPDLREILPPLNLGSAGNMAAQLIEAALRHREQDSKQDSFGQNVVEGPKGWFACGAFNREDRRRALDDLGFKHQLIFSTFATTQFYYSPDPKIRYGGTRAHNRGIADFCKGDARMIAVGVLPTDDIETAREEIFAAAKDGCRAMWISASPSADKSPGHPEMDRVWSALAECGMPFMLHVGGGNRVLPKEYANNGKPLPLDWLGGGDNLRFKDYMVLPFAPQMFLTAMVYDGVFDRFPSLRGGVVEMGAGWVPDFLQRLDSGQAMFAASDPQIGALKRRASDIIREHVTFAPFGSEDVSKMVREAGAELFMFSSDYPHPEGGRDPIGKFESLMGELDEDAKSRFFHKNFDRMMGFTPVVHAAAQAAE